jgi:hypothetical protein
MPARARRRGRGGSAAPGGRTGDEPARHLGAAERSEAGGVGDLLDGAPVAEDLETGDVAGDRFRCDGSPKLEQPGPQLGRRNGVDRPRRAEPAEVGRVSTNEPARWP